MPSDTAYPAPGWGVGRGLELAGDNRDAILFSGDERRLLVRFNSGRGVDQVRVLLAA